MIPPAQYDFFGHKFRNFKQNGQLEVGHCELCLDVMAIDSKGNQRSVHSRCDGVVQRTDFNIGWTPEDEKRFAPLRAARADIRFNQTATGVQSAKR